MSGNHVTALPTWLRGQVDAYELAVLFALQSCPPLASPSIRWIQSAAGMSRTKVFEVLSRLEDRGLLERVKQTDHYGSSSCNKYILHIWGDDMPTQKEQSA
jgi:hypothetical protein